MRQTLRIVLFISCLSVAAFAAPKPVTFNLAPRDYATGPVPEAVAVGDFNGDGKPDIVTGGNNNLSVLLGNGDGTFQPPLIRSSGFGGLIAAIVVADFNGDGKLDVALAVANSTENAPGSVLVALGNGDGTFAGQYGFQLANTGRLAVADFNGDGKPDLALVNDGVSSTFIGVEVLLGNGDGSFTQAPGIPMTGTPRFLALADFNVDGKTDVVAGGRS